MTLETIIREACSALTADRVGERKKNAETLKSYLSSSSAPNLLSNNQRNRSGYNWEDVFEQVNEYILKECEKFESSKTFVNTKNLCTSLLHMTIAGANRNGCYIKIDLVISASMHILKSSRLKRAFGDAYLVLLYKHVMPHDTYLGFIKPQEWEDLLSVSLQLCYGKHADIDPVFAGRFLLQVVQNGTNYCHFTISLRNKITDILKVLLQEDLDKKLQEIMLNIAIHFVETLSPECRLTTCEFVEELIPTFLRFYDQTSDMERKKKVLLFHFLSISTSIHNPRGRHKLEGGSLAADWDVWSGHLRSMYKLVNTEALFLLKMYKDSKFKCNVGRNLDINSWFIQLAAQLFHQVCCLRNLAEPKEEAGSCDEIPTKRIKLENEYEFGSLSELIRRLPYNIYPWLRILNNLFSIESFKEKILEQDLCSLLDVLISIMSDYNDTEAEYGFAFPVMSRVIDIMFTKQWYDLKVSYIDQIWDVCIRQCILKKDYNCHMHEIFQKILNSNAATEKMLARLIKIYTDHCVEMSNETLNTLNIILTKNVRNYVKYSVKVQLMNWFVKHAESLQNLEILTEVLFKLIIKEIIPFHLNEIKTPTEDLAYNILFHTIEDNILVSEFELDLSIFENKASQQTPKIDIYVTKYDKLLTDVINIFDTKLNKFPENQIMDTSVINECLKNIHVILQFYKLILQYRVCVENEMFRDPVLMKVKELFISVCMNIAKKIHDDKTAVSDKISILTLLMDIYKTQYCDYIDSFILSISDENFFRTLFAKCNLDSGICLDEADSFIDVPDAVESNENLKSVSLCVLSYYCLKNLEYRNDVLEFILDSDLYNFSYNEDVEYALRVLEILMQCQERDLPGEMIFRFMQKMCKALFRNIAATIKITEMLYKLIPTIGRSDVESLRTNCVIMLRGFVQRCEAHYYPVHYTALVYKSISKISCLAQTQTWNTSLRDNLLKGLYSDIHSIRLYTCYKLEDIARSLEVQSLNEMVEVIFNVEANDATSSVLRDESVNRTATVLHFLVSFAISSPKLILKSISSILETTAVKNLDQFLVKKVLTLIVSRVSRENLHTFLQTNLEHFVNHWLSKCLELNTLAHTLFGYQSFESMLCEHFSLMIPAEIFWNHNGHINLSQLMVMLKNTLNCTDKEIISECFCQIMCISLPHIVTDKYKVVSLWGASTADANSAKIMFNEVWDILRNDEVSILFAHSIGNLLKLFTQHLYDKDHMMESIGCSVTLVDCTKFYFPFPVYKALQKYLNAIADCDILLERCNTEPFSVQSILLELWSDIERECKLDSKLLSLYRYMTFCNSVPLNTRFSQYFIKFVISSLLHTMRKNYEDKSLSKTSPVACLCMFNFLNKVLPEHAKVIDNLLPDIVDMLSIIYNDESEEYVTKTLLLLLRDMKSMLVNSLDAIDRLPNRLVSKMSTMNLNVSLSQEDLEGIIKKVNSAGTGCSYKTLNHLYNSLKNDTTALKELFKRCRQLRGFSEDCRTSILHQLILNLTKIAVDVADSQCRLEATKCLGVIGPADLKTFVLATPEDPSLIVELAPVLYFTLMCLKETNKLIFNSKPEIIRIASLLLKSILSFEEGRTALENLENIISTDELMPYLPTEKCIPPVNININQECFTRNMNRSELWIPSKISHNTWVINLVTCLIQSLSDDKNFLKFLAGMCRLQVSIKCVPSLNINIIRECFTQNMNRSELWIPSKIAHNTWVINLAICLIQYLSDDKNFLKFLAGMCRLQSSLCEEILPSLVGFVLCRAEKEQVDVFHYNINNFFRHYFDKLSPLSQDSNGSSQPGRDQDYEMMVNSNKRSIQLLLKVVDFVRLQSSHYIKRPKEQHDHYNFLKLDYQAVAWAAFATGENISAVMYGELWCTARNNGVPPPGPHATAEMEGLDKMQNIFRNSYVAIGDMDAVYGCGLGHLQSESERRNHYLRLGSFNEAILSNDLSLSHTTDVRLQNGLVKSLYASGLYHLAAQYMKTMPENNHLNDIQYECYMRLGDWSLLPDPSVLSKEELPLVSLSSIKQAVTVHQYACLKEAITGTAAEGREPMLETIIKNAQDSVAVLLDKSNVKTCRKLYEIVAQMQVIEDIHLFSKMRFQHYEPADVIGYWRLSNFLPVNDFKDIEPVLAVRAYMLEYIARTNVGLIEDVVNVQLDYAELGLQNGRQQFSSRLLSIASRLHPGGRASLIEGKVAWASGHQDLGLHLVKTVMNNFELNNNLLKANALRQYGSWMIETKSENAKDIHNKYLKKSLEVLKPNEHSETKLKVYLDIAKFADAEYKQVVTYIKSAIFENKVKCMEKMRGTVNSLRLQDPTQQNLSRDERKTLVMNDKLSLLDEADISNTYADKAKFLNLAVKYYLLSLGQGELNDLCIFRVISLWFANSDLALDSQSEFTLSQLFEAVPSRKFLPVLPQIAPRMSTDKTLFNGYLTRIIERCSLDHPHHTLTILLALNNSHKDKIIINMNEKNQSQTSSSRSRSTKPSSELSIKEESRVIAARQLLAKLTKIDSNIGAMISQMEMMCNAMISLANYKIPKEEMKREMPIPRAEPLTKLKSLDLVLVPTITLPVDKHCLYQNITSVVSFSNKFNLVGGVNAPKKLSCTGSDGLDRPILLKGEDDLRQDAVMQQVFSIVNSLLATNRETSRSGLLIRTYKVVALSHRSGVLEWCSGTEPLAAYLIGTAGDGGAHSRYRPRDISVRAARMMMIKCKGKSNEEKLNVFVKLLSQFKPVFHHFFNERFLSPVTWYERRYAYTNSVATSSMVGYMLGIGDRHVQNILIDKETAEVIHIDFGIAFEQGRALPTPETVPFRLTQDIIAGFGASGVEGLFRRSCEKTLQLLRDNQETLLTIVEVLLYDPLYSWSVSPSQARKKQNVSIDQKETHDNANISGEAERALLVLQSKLEGRANGAVGSMGMGVAGQIARLIQQATDLSNLSRLFDGWQPYL